MMCHLSALPFFYTLLGGIIAPLVVWSIKKDEFAFVDVHGKEAINFQLTMLIYWGIAIALACLTFGASVGVATVFDVVLVVIASVRANSGELYRYPFTIRLIK